MTRYFHGTTNHLPAGTVLLPGKEFGLSFHGRSEHVYGTTTDFDGVNMDWLPAQDTDNNRISTAIDTAMHWASFAADLGGCTTDSCGEEMEDDPDFHYEVYLEGSWLSCIHIYEIEPIGLVEEDGFSDVNASGVRMPSARVLRELTYNDKPMFED